MEPRFVAYFDGACEPKNPGGTLGCGMIVYDRGQVVRRLAFSPNLPPHLRTNNVAEYIAAISILKFLRIHEWNAEPTIIYGDSKLVIAQLWKDPETGRRWQIRNGAYRDYAFMAQNYLNPFTACEGRWIPREQNTVADELSKHAVDIALRGNRSLADYGPHLLK